MEEEEGVPAPARRSLSVGDSLSKHLMHTPTRWFEGGSFVERDPPSRPVQTLSSPCGRLTGWNLQRHAYEDVHLALELRGSASAITVSAVDVAGKQIAIVSPASARWLDGTTRLLVVKVLPEWQPLFRLRVTEEGEGVAETDSVEWIVKRRYVASADKLENPTARAMLGNPPLRLERGITQHGTARYCISKWEERVIQ